MELRVYPDKILRLKAEKVGDTDLEKLYKDMVTAMINYEGLGLAGPQVGLSIRAAVISDKATHELDKPLMLINPVILDRKGIQDEYEEGCLSVMGINACIKRADKIFVETGPDDDRKVIEADGLYSVVIQHEMDHLDGILFPDRLKGHDKIWKLFKARLNKKNAKKA